MQKVEGSNPFSRSQKGLHLQAFFAVGRGFESLQPLSLDSPRTAFAGAA
jgi:hypothetical protein